jgi:hypothetical protein
MQIGFVKRESMTPKGSEPVKWLECYFRIAGVRPFKAKMSPNKNKTEDKHPDYVIYLRGNIDKGDTFRDIAIGSLWIGEKEFDGVLKKFMTGSIEIAFQKVSIAVWKAEPRFEGEVVNYLYDIKTMVDKRRLDDETVPQTEEDTSHTRPPVVIDIDDDEIPF